MEEQGLIWLRSCATDASGNVYSSWTDYFNHWNCHNRCSPNYIWRGHDDAFLVKFNSSGVRQWGTYYGGTGYDDGFPAPLIRVETFTSLDILNSTTGIATTGAHQTTLEEGPRMPF